MDSQIYKTNAENGSFKVHFLLHSHSAAAPAGSPQTLTRDAEISCICHSLLFPFADPSCQNQAGNNSNQPLDYFFLPLPQPIFHALCLSCICSRFACVVGRGGIVAGPHNSSGSNNRSLSRWSAPLPRASLCSFCLFSLFFFFLGCLCPESLVAFFFSPTI